MRQPTSKELYAYWDDVRNGRVAPRRFEIEPAKIAGLLGETFIAECTGLLGFRFRLAGTRICQQFGRELRGIDFLGLWSMEDRAALSGMVRSVLNDGTVGYGVFSGYTKSGRECAFEFTLMPLIHTGQSVNRLLGSITAIEPPFWLGTEKLTDFRIAALELHWPDDNEAQPDGTGTKVVPLSRPRFRVLEGGLSHTDQQR